jgi:hypothetical protein
MESKTESNSVKAQTVQIANPIYGYAFKYFMDDEAEQESLLAEIDDLRKQLNNK